MNPLDMMKFKGMFEKFVTRHPMLPKFFARIQPEVKEGSVIELTVTPPDGEPLKANIKAQADGFVREFPDGYNTQIVQGGNNVSGGQKQRLWY